MPKISIDDSRMEINDPCHAGQSKVIDENVVAVAVVVVAVVVVVVSVTF
jgi:hypothetical protein